MAATVGRGRGGWYFTARIERFLIPDASRRGSRTFLPQFQQLRVGDVVPNWGPGMLEVLRIEPNRLLIHGSVTPGDPPGEFLISGVHLLEPIGDDSTRIYARLRIRPSRNAVLNAFVDVIGPFDWATIALMYAGFHEIVTDSNWPNPGLSV